MLLSQAVAEISTRCHTHEARAGWQRRRDLHLVLGQMTANLQVRVKPGKVKVGSPTIGVIHGKQAKEISIARQLRPRQAMRGPRDRPPDSLALHRRHARLLGGSVAEPPIPDCTPEDAQRSEDEKRCAPSKPLLYGNHEWRSQRAAGRSCHP